MVICPVSFLLDALSMEFSLSHTEVGANGGQVVPNLDWARMAVDEGKAH